MAVPVHNLQHLSSGRILASTKVVMDILPFGKCVLLSESHCFCPHPTRRRIDNNSIEVRLISATYVSPVRIFVGTSDSTKMLEHRSIEVVLMSIGIRRQV